MHVTDLRGLCIGTGYFSRFHLDAWQRLPGVEIVAVCDLDPSAGRRAAAEFGIARAFTNVRVALDAIEPDFVDIVTPPDTHLSLVEETVGRGLPTICQKPLAPDFTTAQKLADVVRQSGVPFMVHENFRFQPWHREIKRLLDAGAIGSTLHTLTFRTRTGDGWGPDAYLARQPYFRDMPQLLVHETGVHFIDTFRYLAGEIDEAYAVLRRLNPVIRGEDAGLLTFRFSSGAVGVWDANRFNESTATDPRYTFGNFLVEGNGGSVRLYSDGRITIQPLGEPERDHSYECDREHWGGDCVRQAQRHFIERLRKGEPFETNVDDYLQTLTVQEAVYRSAAENRPIRVKQIAPAGSSTASGAATPPSATSTESRSRVIDLSLPIDGTMRGVTIRPAATISADGWNATTLSLYSHCGTHMDAPRHFVADASTIDRQDLSICCGRALVIDFTPVAPRELLTIERLGRWADRVRRGDRLLLRTDWYHRHGSDSYRNELPRVSLELAEWLVERGVALVGVEPPSVADVNNLEELTAVHQTLFHGGVVIVEGLAHLDSITSNSVEFVALPLKVAGGDGSPVRAIAIERASDSDHGE